MQRPLSSFRLLVGVLILLALVALVLQQFQGSSPVRPESEDVIGGSGSTAQPLCGPACAEPAEDSPKSVEVKFPELVRPPEPESEPTSHQSERSWFSVRVLDAVGNPVHRAKAKLEIGGRTFQDSSDRDGIAIFSVVPADRDGVLTIEHELKNPVSLEVHTPAQDEESAGLRGDALEDALYDRVSANGPHTEVTLEPADGVEILGVYVDADNNAIAGVTIWAEMVDSRSSFRLNTTTTDLNGRFAFTHVMPGRYVLRAGDYRSSEAWCETEEFFAGASEWVELKRQSLSGRVLLPDGSPVAGAEVLVGVSMPESFTRGAGLPEPKIPEFRRWATSNPLGGSSSGQNYSNKRTNTDGSFRFTTVRYRGNVQVTVRLKDESFYVWRVTFSGQDSLSRDFVLTELVGDYPSSVYVYDSATGRSLAAAIKYDRADEDVRCDRRVGVSDSETGRFSVENLTVGRWRVTVTAEGYAERSEILVISADAESAALEFALDELKDVKPNK